MKFFGFLITLICIGGVIAPVGKIFFSKQTEKDMHTEFFTLLLLLFVGLPVLGFAASYLFGNDLAIGIAIILGLVGINILVFKDRL